MDCNNYKNLFETNKYHKLKQSIRLDCVFIPFSVKEIQLETFFRETELAVKWPHFLVLVHALKLDNGSFLYILRALIMQHKTH